MKIISTLLILISQAIALDFESFFIKLQDLSNSVTNTNVKSVISKLGYNHDVLDELIMFTKYAIITNPQLIQEVIKNINKFTNPLIKAAVIKAISLNSTARHIFKSSEIFQQEQSNYKQACFINYRFDVPIYPGHLFICYMATGDETYVSQMVKYLSFKETEKPENIEQLLTQRIVEKSEKEKFNNYVFFLETKRILQKHITNSSVRLLLKKISRSSEDAAIKKQLEEILND